MIQTRSTMCQNCAPRLDVVWIIAPRDQQQNRDPRQDMGGVKAGQQIVEQEERVGFIGDTLRGLAGVFHAFDDQETRSPSSRGPGQGKPRDLSRGVRRLAPAQRLAPPDSLRSQGPRY